MSDTYEERISELKLEADERESLRYSEAFRAKAVELVGHLKSDGWTQRRITQELEISWQTLGRWCRQAESDGTEAGSERFPPVEVVAADSSGSADGIALVSPSGRRIEGLTVGEAVEAARRLR